MSEKGKKKTPFTCFGLTELGALIFCSPCVRDRFSGKAKRRVGIGRRGKGAAAVERRRGGSVNRGVEASLFCTVSSRFLSVLSHKKKTRQTQLTFFFLRSSIDRFERRKRYDFWALRSLSLALLSGEKKSRRFPDRLGVGSRGRRGAVAGLCGAEK